MNNLNIRITFYDTVTSLYVLSHFWYLFAGEAEGNSNFALNYEILDTNKLFGTL